MYRCAKQYSEPTSGKRGDKRGTKADELHLTPLELIDRIAAVVPPPRTHRHRYLRAAHYPCAVLIARIYEVFPLLCPLCGGQMRIIAFITHSADIRHILEHIGVACEPPHIYPARGPPLWERSDALAGEGSQIVSDWDLAAQPTPDYEADQRVSW